MRATVCKPKLAEAEAEAGVEDGAENGSIVDILFALLKKRKQCQAELTPLTYASLYKKTGRQGHLLAGSLVKSKL